MPDEEKIVTDQTGKLTLKQQEELKITCDHVGTHGPCAQNVIMLETQMLIVTSHICMYCGRQFSNIEPVPFPKEPAESVKKPLIIS